MSLRRRPSMHVPVTGEEWQAMYARLIAAGHGSRIHTHDDGIKVNVGTLTEPCWERLTWERAHKLLEHVAKKEKRPIP